MGFILILLIILSLSGSLAVLGNRKIEETAPVAMMSIIMLIYICGLLFHNIPLGVYLSIGFSVPAIAFLIFTFINFILNVHMQCSRTLYGKCYMCWFPFVWSQSQGQDESQAIFPTKVAEYPQRQTTKINDSSLLIKRKEEVFPSLPKRTSMETNGPESYLQSLVYEQNISGSQITSGFSIQYNQVLSLNSGLLFF